MRLLVTCGPAYEPLDEVRRLTNFSTGKLGIGLANYLVTCGHEVAVLKGFYATCAEPCRAQVVSEFTTTESLAQQLRDFARQDWHAVFHAAAVSDFRFGSVFERRADGTLHSISSAKFGTRAGALLAELIPTVKLIASLRADFLNARIFGWKYEVEGSPENAIGLGRRQISENKTDFCVVNGRAYGEGFGIVGVGNNVIHCPAPEVLYASLESLARS